MVAARDTGTVTLETELRRGVLVLAVLSQLRTTQYGYSLRQALAEQGMPIEEGTLYPLLSKLRREELVDYEWQESDAGPPRKYYKLTPKGRTQLATLNDYWKNLNRTLADFGN